MRYSLFLLFFVSFGVHSQNLDVRFDNSIQDFGYIKEVDGKVYTEFEFQNYSKFKISVFKVISSCGCAIATSEDGWINPQGKGKIKVVYDPTGRPGKFVKSFEIQFISDSLKKSAFLNIRGYTIEKELLETYVDNLYEGTELMIKPYETSLISGSDLRFLSDEKWQHFINDITFEIDQNDFANVKLEMTIDNYKDSTCQLAKEVYPIVHKNIISELERRKYTSWSVGFTDSPCKANKKSDGIMGGELKVSSLDYNNDTIPESGFYFSGKEVDLSKFSMEYRDSVDYEKKIINRFLFSDIKFLNPEKNKDYSNYLNLLNRRILLDKKAYAGLIVEVKCRKQDQEKVKLKILNSIKSIYAKINLDADNSGAIISKIYYSVPEINFVYDSTLKSGKYIQKPWKLNLFYPELSAESLNEFEQFANQNTVGNKKLTDFLTQTGFKAPFQNLPVLELTHTGIFSIDTTTPLFKSWINIIKEEWKNNRKIELLIESSIGRSPIVKSTESEYLSRKNAKKFSDDLLKIISQAGIPDSIFEIKIVSTIVQGSNYVGKEFDLSFNQKYNFLKIIPKYSKIEKELKVALIPYQISFNNNSFDLPVETAIFQNFISRLVLVLENEGVINIIIESSSSKIPSTIYKNNELLSFFRAEESAQKVKEEIRKRGYDPTRVIVSELRTLVQGPEFKAESDRKKHPYERYQYVKIIPTELIKK
jgi:hypothetical protein